MLFSKKSFLSTTFAIASVVLSTNSYAALIDVFQGGDFIGQIESYKGAASAADNWTQNTGPAIGPDGVPDQGSVFFYETNTGDLSFNVLWNMNSYDDLDPSDVLWDIKVTGSSSELVVADDYVVGDEDIWEVASNHYQTNWRWGPFADGGVIDGLTGDWQITIDPTQYTDINALFASGLSNLLALNLDVNSDIVFKAPSSEVPEPSTIAIAALGLLGLARMRRVKK